MIGAKSYLNQFKRNFPIEIEEGNNLIERNQNLKLLEFTNQFYLLTKYREKYAFKIGGEHNFRDINYEVIENNEESKRFFEKSHYFSPFAEVIIDTYDKKNFTTKGMYFNPKVSFYISSTDYNDDFEPFTQLTANFGLAKTYKKFTTHLTADVGLTFGKPTNSYNYFLGGNIQTFNHNFSSFYGYDVAELSNANFLKPAIKFSYEIFEKNYLSAKANYLSIKNDFFDDNKYFEDVKAGYVFGYGVDSFLGPIELKYAYSPDNREAYWYFNIGYWF
jgi:NTE family protein